MRTLKQRRENAAVLPALHDLAREYRGQSQSVARSLVIEDYILYAEIGRDRKKLDLSWVDRCREALEESLAWERQWQSLRTSDDATCDIPDARPIYPEVS